MEIDCPRIKKLDSNSSNSMHSKRLVKLSKNGKDLAPLHFQKINSNQIFVGFSAISLITDTILNFISVIKQRVSFV